MVLIHKAEGLKDFVVALGKVRVSLMVWAFFRTEWFVWVQHMFSKSSWICLLPDNYHREVRTPTTSSVLQLYCGI